VTNFFIGVGLFALASSFLRARSRPVHLGRRSIADRECAGACPGWWWRLWTEGTADYFPLMSLTLWIEYHLGRCSDKRRWRLVEPGLPRALRHPGRVEWLSHHEHPVSCGGGVAHVANVEAAAGPGGGDHRGDLRGASGLRRVGGLDLREEKLYRQIFFLLSIIHYVRYEEKATKWRYVAAVICFTLSLLAKTSVVMLPFILLLLAWWR